MHNDRTVDKTFYQYIYFFIFYSVKSLYIQSKKSIIEDGA